MIPNIDKAYSSNGQLAGKASPTIVPKRWDQEEIFVNGSPIHNTDFTSTYCMKVITIEPGQKTSSHFHVNKHETLLVVGGELCIQYKDSNGLDVSQWIATGEAFVIPPGFIHRLEAGSNEACIIVEASTPDDPKDSIRVSL